MNSVHNFTSLFAIFSYKKGLKRFVFTLILLLLTVFFIIANTFFSAPINLQENSTEDITDTEKSEDVKNKEIENSEQSEPIPVRVGSTNPDMAKKQGDIRESIATFFKQWQT